MQNYMLCFHYTEKLFAADVHSHFRTTTQGGWFHGELRCLQPLGRDSQPIAHICFSLKWFLKLSPPAWMVDGPCAGKWTLLTWSWTMHCIMYVSADLTSKNYRRKLDQLVATRQFVFSSLSSLAVARFLPSSPFYLSDLTDVPLPDNRPRRTAALPRPRLHRTRHRVLLGLVSRWFDRKPRSSRMELVVVWSLVSLFFLFPFSSPFSFFLSLSSLPHVFFPSQIPAMWILLRLHSNDLHRPRRGVLHRWPFRSSLRAA